MIRIPINQPGFGPPPFEAAPDRWVTIDPAGVGSKKPSLAVFWKGREARSFVPVRTEVGGWWVPMTIDVARGLRFEPTEPSPSLVVIEEGFARVIEGHSPKSIGDLAEARGRFHAWAQIAGARLRRPLPDHWRRVLSLPMRVEREIVNGQRELCRRLATQRPGGTMPHVKLAAQATNDDKRAALLIGVAAIVAGGW